LSTPQWRIDGLAREAGVTVDTIRYYAREGLLPAPERSGRHKLYGPDHVERLARIRELQERRFSLAAIRAVLDAETPGLANLFGSDGGYSFDELVIRSGVDAGLVADLRDVGLLPDPTEFGQEAYDETDLVMLRAVRELLDVGMTREILVELAGIYVRQFRALQAEVHGVLAGETRDWDPGQLRAMQVALTEHTQQLIPAIERVLNHVHQRTVQRLTLAAIHRAQHDHLGVGGLPVADA
jgi:DNA-binding transcriptional MerR regulator